MIQQELELRIRALLGNLRNAASDVLDPWNKENRPRSQYMHRFRDQHKKLLVLLEDFPKEFQVPQILKDLDYFFRNNPKATKENSEEVSVKLLEILGNYGITPTRDLSGVS